MVLLTYRVDNYFSMLSLRARRINASLLVSVLFLVLFSTPSKAIEKRFIDVAAISWKGSLTPTPTIQDVAKSITTKVIDNWREFTTPIGGNTESAVYFSLDRVLESPITIDSRMSCEGLNFGSFRNSISSEVYNRLGIQDWKSRYLVILAPPSGCIWSGRAAVGDPSSKGGFVVLHNTASPFVITHELGHSLGLGHSNLMRCENQARDGQWGSNCKAVEYGGSIDVMGNVDTQSSLSTYHQWRIGLLDSEEVYQSWLNESIELAASDVNRGFRAVFIRDGLSAYWIEYRRPNSKNTYKPGLVVVRTDPPPSSSVDSPNPEDLLAENPGMGVGADYWMLNLDNHFYLSTGRASGSMTLPVKETFTFFSGNVKIEALPTENENQVTLKVTRNKDSTPPPTPILSAQEFWNSPNSQILESGYEDLESQVSHFELKINDRVFEEKISEKAEFVPTFLDPFVSRKTLYARNLPEGNYSLSVRSVDFWGNESEWSPKRQVLIDRSDPTIGVKLDVTRLQGSNFRGALGDFGDRGSGLCRTVALNRNGFVSQLSISKQSPEFNFQLGDLLDFAFETYDCLGNGVKGSMRIQNSFNPAKDLRKNGKWMPVKIGNSSGVKCVGRCSISYSAKDNVAVVFGEGSADVLMSGRKIADIVHSSNLTPRPALNVPVGDSRKLLRISGRDFTVFGLIVSRVRISEFASVKRKVASPDLSLSRESQQRLSIFGFNQEDFSNSWNVVPMNRGTTLLDPTLDLCSNSYKSEAGRQYRRQMIALNPESQYPFVSSEVVKYQDKSASMFALMELKDTLSICVKNKGAIQSDGSFVRYEFFSVRGNLDGLVSEENRVVISAQIGMGQSARQLFAIYQFKDEMFTGLYIAKDGDSRFSGDEINDWLDVGRILASRLERKF